MKLKEFQKELKKRGIDCCILANLKNKDENCFYLLQKELDYCLLLIPNRGKSRLFIPSSRIRKTKSAGKVIKKDFMKLAFLKKHLKRVRKIGINKNMLALNTYKQLRKIKKAEYVDVSELLYKLRETKTAAEIKKIKKACKMADKIIQKCIKQFKKFKTEGDVESFLKSQGSDLSFKPIIASGTNSSTPHYHGSGRLRKGFCVIDFGVRNEGYCSDMTRTIYLGKPSKKEIEMYNLLLNTQKSAIKKLKPGTTIKEINELIKKSLGKHSRSMVHGFGHSLGIEVHDTYKYKDEKRFLIGTVFTIEPGIYFKNKFGIRIEDDVLLTKTGCELLTKAPKKLVIVR
jgi:Xaa-Pro aminopeptidase